jgi:hypothetical protein
MRLKNASIFAIGPPEAEQPIGQKLPEGHPKLQITSDRVKFSSSLALLFLAVDADARPRNGVESGGFDFFFAIHADSVDPLIHPMDRLFDGAKDLGIGLFKGEMNVKIAFLAGLVDPIAAF